MKKSKSSFAMEKLILRISICVLYFAAKTTGQDIQNKNIHCDKWDSIAEEHIEYSQYNDYDYYYGRHTTTRKTYTYTYECTVRNYEIASDRDYYIDKSDKIYKLTIEDSSMNGLPVKLFKHLTNLQTLIVKKTSLQHVDEIKLPKVTQIDLSENEIVSLHENTFAECSKLSEINLSNNNISILQGPFFDSNQKIRILDLSYNKITNITEYTFNDFHVESLKLSHNHLEGLDLNRFSELSQLNSLDLSYNKLKSIETFEDFEGGNFTAESVQLQFNNLTSLNLKYCDIKQIYASNNKLKSVEIGGNCFNLDLQNNEITDLTLSASLNSLNYLYMNENNLGNDLQDICKCTSLVELYLDNNKIDNLGSCLSQMIHLSQLTLKGNKIYELTHDNFSPNNRITYLDLSFNQLESIDEYTMSTFTKLTTLLLAGNRIVDFYDNPKDLMPNIDKIGLSHNKFKCSKLYLLLRQFKKQNVEVYVDKGSPFNTTNINGIQCFYNHEQELLKSSNSTDTLPTKAEEKIFFILEKLKKIENKVNINSNNVSSVGKSMQEIWKITTNLQKQLKIVENSLSTIKQNISSVESMDKKFKLLNESVKNLINQSISVQNLKKEGEKDQDNLKNELNLNDLLSLKVKTDAESSSSNTLNYIIVFLLIAIGCLLLYVVMKNNKNGWNFYQRNTRGNETPLTNISNM